MLLNIMDLIEAKSNGKVQKLKVDAAGCITLLKDDHIWVCVGRELKAHQVPDPGRDTSH